MGAAARKRRASFSAHNLLAARENGERVNLIIEARDAQDVEAPAHLYALLRAEAGSLELGPRSLLEDFLAAQERVATAPDEGRGMKRKGVMLAFAFSMTWFHLA